MAEKPLLIFPVPSLVNREAKTAGGGQLHLPTHDRQSERLAPMFNDLQRLTDTKRIEIRSDPTGIVPEQVLVLETIGTIEGFINAVRKIPGMEWLGEIDTDSLPDDDFYESEKNKDKKLKGRLFLIMTDQSAISNLLSLWNQYQKDEDIRFARGLNRWKSLFKQLKTLRLWGIQDRLEETGILEDWEERTKVGQEKISFEIEVWFRDNERVRREAQRILEDLIKEAGGRVISQSIIPEIAYHAVLSELPISAISAILISRDTKLVRSDYVMFFRPIGQASFAYPKVIALPDGPSMDSLPTYEGKKPIVALLDGLPLSEHKLLSGRLIIDDPDDWGADYQASERNHGTSMASLIIHGGLDTGEIPLERPLYARPILRPVRAFDDLFRESIPEDTLAIDIVHRAVNRLFLNESSKPEMTQGICVINFSICDTARPFDYVMSPLARLLDWLAWKFKVLFIVSAGNQSGGITLEKKNTKYLFQPLDEIENLTLKAIASDMRNRRLLSPAEAINVLTVGATHEDTCQEIDLSNRIEVFTTSGLPSPINSLGLGFHRTIKPEVLMPGGRQLYKQMGLNRNNNQVVLEIDESLRSPGLLSASPGNLPGDLSKVRYTRGTSNATALTTRTAARLYELLNELREVPNGELLEDKFNAVILKSLLVHGAYWGEAYDILERVLKGPENSRQFREYVTRFLGYGRIQTDRLFECTDQRATILGCSTLKDGEGHLYSVPLPASLSGKRVWRRLTITLAWISPINPVSNRYRRAALWFELVDEILRMERREADARATQRGTVQHEVFEDNKAISFSEGDSIQISVNCRGEDSPLTDEINYALIVTLEVAEGVEIPVYEEIRTRITPTIRITPATL